MKKGIRLFTTLMVCMAMALCVSCKKDNAEPNGAVTQAEVVTQVAAEAAQVAKSAGVLA